jgi:hypothetical protein
MPNSISKVIFRRPTPTTPAATPSRGSGFDVDTAKNLISSGKAAYDDVTGWQVMHMMAGEPEWFSVTEEHADILDRAARELVKPAVAEKPADEFA